MTQENEIVYRKIQATYDITPDMLDDNLELMQWLHPEAGNVVRRRMGLQALPIDPRNPNQKK